MSAKHYDPIHDKMREEGACAYAVGIHPFKTYRFLTEEAAAGFLATQPPGHGMSITDRPATK